MKLALRKSHPQNAKWQYRAFATLTKWRLVSDYSHGGIVIGNKIYHTNAQNGLHESEFNPDRWDLFDIEGDEEDTLALFEMLKGMPYDYLGLLAFVSPFVPGSDSRMYCFEWCALVMGMELGGRVTAEMLLRKALIDSLAHADKCCNPASSYTENPSVC